MEESLITWKNGNQHKVGTWTSFAIISDAWNAAGVGGQRTKDQHGCSQDWLSFLRMALHPCFAKQIIPTLCVCFVRWSTEFCSMKINCAWRPSSRHCLPSSSICVDKHFICLNNKRSIGACFELWLGRESGLMALSETNERHHLLLRRRKRIFLADALTFPFALR